MKLSCGLIFCLLCFIFPAISFGQKWIGEKPVVCTNHPINKGKYKILSHSLVKALLIDLEIKPKYRTDDNYITIAKEFREKYCLANIMYITYFVDKKQWLSIDLKDPASTPLAIYYYGKKDGIERITFFTVLNGKVGTRQLDLTQ